MSAAQIKVRKLKDMLCTTRYIHILIPFIYSVLLDLNVMTTIACHDIATCKGRITLVVGARAHMQCTLLSQMVEAPSIQFACTEEDH